MVTVNDTIILRVYLHERHRRISQTPDWIWQSCTAAWFKLIEGSTYLIFIFPTVSITSLEINQKDTNDPSVRLQLYMHI